MLYSLGYQGGDVQRAEQMVLASTAILIDVRFSPHSPNPDFSGAAFARRLGHGYLHLQSLGNVNYKSGGAIQLLDEPAGVREVLRIARSGLAPILMCACRNYDACHRKVVAEKIAAAMGGVPIIELASPTRPDSQATFQW